MLKGKNITFSYSDSAKGKIQILKDISFHINKGDFIGVIGAVSGAAIIWKNSFERYDVWSAKSGDERTGRKKVRN